ncbi:hypothetical protein M438DRAFT_150162 [Aureobasidium pullulans EXF-150]|uniref:Uncharacterized protein n=1 Tax=Aureobasidium pullulans EXF-150 TaxID=1043002 RepID=A0A074XB63_AURPU|nr:uncharacterized protein M438DRAFT_150162 [Aureobasidium pullulans EXF-150]KEQ79297.1 hypothetical protein M438DRAFT_150162 [Aureobasidium pullulans EXF-150]
MPCSLKTRTIIDWSKLYPLLQNQHSKIQSIIISNKTLRSIGLLIPFFFFAMHISDFLGDFQSLSYHCFSLTPFLGFIPFGKGLHAFGFMLLRFSESPSRSHDLIVNIKLPLPSFYRMVLPILGSCRSRLLSFLLHSSL